MRGLIRSGAILVLALVLGLALAIPQAEAYGTGWRAQNDSTPWWDCYTDYIYRSFSVGQGTARVHYCQKGSKRGYYLHVSSPRRADLAAYMERTKPMSYTDMEWASRYGVFSNVVSIWNWRWPLSGDICFRATAGVNGTWRSTSWCQRN